MMLRVMIMLKPKGFSIRATEKPKKLIKLAINQKTRTSWKRNLQSANPMNKSPKNNQLLKLILSNIIHLIKNFNY